MLFVVSYDEMVINDYSDGQGICIPTMFKLQMFI